MTAEQLDMTDDRTAVLARGFDGFAIRVATHDGVRIGYRVAGSGPAVLLVHGWPQSGHTWHSIAADLARDHRVVVPDYRGAAGSDKPASGYDKATMAADLRAVLTDAGVDEAHIVGHDIGMMVAYAFARRYPAATRTLTLIDGLVPGTPMFTRMMSSLGPWHFGFHSQVPLATALVTGRERAYFDHFFDGAMVDATAMTDTDRDFYAAAFRTPEALAAGFRTYAAATTVDAEDNARTLATDGKLTVPVLGIGGAASTGPWLDAILTEVADDVRTTSVEGAGHFLPEENPRAIIDALRRFIS